MTISESILEGDAEWSKHWLESVRRYYDLRTDDPDASMDLLDEACAELMRHYLPDIRRVVYHLTGEHELSRATDLTIDIFHAVRASVPWILKDPELNLRAVTLRICFAASVLYMRTM